MNMIEAVKSVFSKYATFGGRASRSEYWWWTLFYYLFLIVVVLLPMGDVRLFIIAIFLIGTIIPNIAVTVRRLHDSEKSGWLFLVNFIPYVGPIVLIVLCVLPSTDGTNRYGEHPLNPEAAQAAVFD